MTRCRYLWRLNHTIICGRRDITTTSSCHWMGWVRVHSTQSAWSGCVQRWCPWMHISTKTFTKVSTDTSTSQAISPIRIQTSLLNKCRRIYQKAYRRVWDTELSIHAGAPVNKRIKEDIEQVVNKTYLDIFYWRDMVINTAAYTGRRAVEQRERHTAQHGGNRTKGTGPVRKYWVHPEVKQYEANIMVECRRNFTLSVPNS